MLENGWPGVRVQGWPRLRGCDVYPWMWGTAWPGIRVQGWPQVYVCHVELLKVCKISL